MLFTPAETKVVVVGGGNFWRGITAQNRGMDRATDQSGTGTNQIEQRKWFVEPPPPQSFQGPKTSIQPPVTIKRTGNTHGQHDGISRAVQLSDGGQDQCACGQPRGKQDPDRGRPRCP